MTYHARIFDPERTPGLALELLPSGKKRWRFRRKIVGKKVFATVFGDLYPTFSIAWAREWARKLDVQVEAGIDPRETAREEDARNSMTVAKAHGLYMVAVREGRSSRAKRPNKPHTISDKLEINERVIAPKLAGHLLYDVTEADHQAGRGKGSRHGWLPSSRCSSAGPPRCAASKSDWK